MHHAAAYQVVVKNSTYPCLSSWL